MQLQFNTATRSLTALTVAAALLVSGCANMTETQSDSAKGAGIGALAGAVLGGLTGGSKGATQGAVIGAGAGALGGYIWSTRMQEQKRAMEAATAGTGIGVSQTADNRLKLDVPADAGFSTGSSTLSPTMVRVLGQFATTLQQNQATQVAIIGHTDNTGSDAVNNPLSFNRANATRDYLARHGHPSDWQALMDTAPSHHFCSYGRDELGPPTWLYYDGATGELHTFLVPARVRCDSLEVVAAGAIAGLGIARLPQWLAAQAVAAGTLVPLFSEVRPFGYALHAVWPSARALPRRTRVVIDTLAAQLPSVLGPAITDCP